MFSYRYILTGATGFLGQVILNNLSGEVIKVGRNTSNDIQCDLSLDVPELPSADTVIHCAGKAHMVPRSQKEKNEFYLVNFNGTLNLLKGLEHNPLKQFIFISTVAVYGLDEGVDIDESFPLLGTTPYAKSKILAEEAVQKWCATNDVACLILRLPLIVGPSPPGNFRALSRAIKRRYYIKIVENNARKSTVVAGDVARFVAGIKNIDGIYNITDGVHPYFCDIEDAVAKALKTSILWRLPLSLFQLLARGGDLMNKMGLPFLLNSAKVEKMTSTLIFSDKKARDEIGWVSQSAVEFIEKNCFDCN